MIDSESDRREIVERAVNCLEGLYVCFRLHLEEKADTSYRLKEIRTLEMQLKHLFVDQLAGRGFRDLDLALEWAEKLILKDCLEFETAASCAERLWQCRQGIRMLCPAGMRQRKLTEWLPKRRIRKTRAEELERDELEEIVMEVPERPP